MNKKCKTCMCMDCGKLIKVTEQSKHLKDCPKRAYGPALSPSGEDLTEQPECKTCGGSKKKWVLANGERVRRWIPCPDCAEQPKKKKGWKPEDTPLKSDDTYIHLY